jgi:hypothetical protein
MVDRARYEFELRDVGDGWREVRLVMHIGDGDDPEQHYIGNDARRRIVKFICATFGGVAQPVEPAFMRVAYEVWVTLSNAFDAEDARERSDAQ